MLRGDPGRGLEPPKGLKAHIPDRLSPRKPESSRPAGKATRSIDGTVIPLLLPTGFHEHGQLTTFRNLEATYGGGPVVILRILGDKPESSLSASGSGDTVSRDQ
jgi:hypothetical protein